MSAAQRSEVICNAIQVVPIWRYLRPRVISRQLLSAVVHTRRKRRRHVIGEVEILQRIVDKGLHFVREVALRGESLEMDEENGWQPRQRDYLRWLAHRLAVGTVPTARTLSEK